MKSLKGKLFLLLFTIVWAVIWLIIGTTLGMEDTGKCYMGQQNYCAGTCTPNK
jgi:hypothetical protein